MNFLIWLLLGIIFRLATFSCLCTALWFQDASSIGALLFTIILSALFTPSDLCSPYWDFQD